MFDKLISHFQNNDIIYEGEWKNGMRDGTGKQIWPDGSVYDGEWVESKFCGRGKFVLMEQDDIFCVYDGEWKYKKDNRKGTHVYVNVEQETDREDDKQYGEGIENRPDEAKQIGKYYYGNVQGEGFLQYSGLSRKQGEKIDDSAQGKYVWLDNRIYTGYWKNCKFHGKGQLISPDDKKSNTINSGHGKGVFEFADGRKYIGTWIQGQISQYFIGKQHGIGILNQGNPSCPYKY